MWLIHTESLKLEHFVRNHIPEYAILSHTWEDGEVTFRDWQDLEKASKKKGFAKIKSACALAQADEIDYIWVDTNCIDKSSSAKLSKAINSMFAWYGKSKVCYVYLVDVEDPDDVAGKLGDGEIDHFDRRCYFDKRNPIEDIKKAILLDSLRNSRWFTRGWTLQELLAPTSICFLTREWKVISMRPPSDRYHIDPYESKLMQKNLLRIISDITSIPLAVLVYPGFIMPCSVGEKMSWMAGRETTRKEDIAYCLLGIFGINMPILYGEGSKAFERLQAEIAKQSTDHSLFAWQWPQYSAGMQGSQPNLFAESTELFANFNTKLFSNFNSEVMLIFTFNPRRKSLNIDEKEYQISMRLTDFGLSINLELIPTACPDYVFAVLYIMPHEFRSLEVSPDQELWCIPLQKIGKVCHRVPFPPGPFPIRTRRKRFIYPLSIIHSPRSSLVFRPPSLSISVRIHYSLS